MTDKRQEDLATPILKTKEKPDMVKDAVDYGTFDYDNDNYVVLSDNTITEEKIRMNRVLRKNLRGRI